MLAEALETLLKNGRVVRGETLMRAGEENRPEMRKGEGLLCGGVHEFFLVDDLPTMGGRWSAALVVMGAVAQEALRHKSAEEKKAQRHKGTEALRGAGAERPLPSLSALVPQCLSASGGGIVWVGRRCWPTFQFLCGALGEEGLRGSVFLDPLTDEERFWAIGQALRCPGVRLVMADGSGMNETVSRRLQLGAVSGGALGLLARPSWERETSSWARGRWVVRPVTAEGEEGVMRWEVTGCGGERTGQDAPWMVEWRYDDYSRGRLSRNDGVSDATRAFRIFAGVGRGADSAALAEGRRTA